MGSSEICRSTGVLDKDMRKLVFLFVVLLQLAVAQNSVAQSAVPMPSPSPSPSPSPTVSPRPSLEKDLLKNIIKDQYAIWTSPFQFRKNDLPWALPLAGASAALLATDERTAGTLDNNTTRLRISHDVSRLGTGYAVGGAAVSIYIVGRATHNARARETGLLAFEALINTGIVTQVIKSATQRPRPLQMEGEGEFFTHGSSFVSGHSSSIWSLAAVIDGEYGKRHPVVRYGVFGLATAVSLSRYTGRNHFLSDVLLGGALGYGIGHFVYLRHHDPNLDIPNGTKPTTKLERYFPRITPEYNAHTKICGAMVAWNF